MRARCNPVIVLTALLLVLPTVDREAIASDITRPTSAPSPTDCVAVYQGALGQQGTVTDYQAGASIDCGRPGNTTPYGAASAFTQADTVQDDTPCTVLYYAPVKFQNFPNYIHASWTSPIGLDGSANLDPNSTGDVVTAAGETAATNDVFAVYSRTGVFQAGQCQPSGAWGNFCQLGAPGPNPDPCILAQPHVIVPANSPPPPIAPYIANVIRDLKTAPGAVNSLPSPNGLVNLPTCFWIDNIAVPAERDLSLVLAGAPDNSGRRIFYTYLIRVFFAGVDWNFDDPFGNDQVQPNPACGQHPQLTAHSYQMISEKHSADGFYHITATEKYQVTVDLYWDDTYGAHHATVDPGVPLPITISPPQAYEQYVGQVEAIPMSG
jgi:hypothetical protein